MNILNKIISFLFYKEYYFSFETNRKGDNIMWVSRHIIIRADNAINAEEIAFSFLEKWNKEEIEGKKYTWVITNIKRL